MLQFLFSCKVVCDVIKTGYTFEKCYILASCRAVFLVWCGHETVSMRSARGYSRHVRARCRRPPPTPIGGAPRSWTRARCRHLATSGHHSTWIRSLSADGARFVVGRRPCLCEKTNHTTDVVGKGGKRTYRSGGVVLARQEMVRRLLHQLLSL